MATTEAAGDEKPMFTEKEERVLKIAWRCLKSGPPEMDMEKLTRLGGFNTTKTATNTWGVIKKKLFAMAEEGENGTEAVKGDGDATPKRKRAAPKKAAAKADDGEGEADGSPKKKTRKTPTKKKAAAKEDPVKEDEDADADGEDVKEEDGA